MDSKQYKFRQHNICDRQLGLVKVWSATIKLQQDYAAILSISNGTFLFVIFEFTHIRLYANNDNVFSGLFWECYWTLIGVTIPDITAPTVLRKYLTMHSFDGDCGNINGYETEKFWVGITWNRIFPDKNAMDFFRISAKVFKATSFGTEEQL